MSRSRTNSWRSFDPDAARPAARVAVAPPADCVVLGLDPGSHRTGYGVIRCRGGDYEHVAHGCIEVSGAELAVRLRRINEGVSALLAEHRPGEIAIERVFVNRNADSALKLGQARGAALAAIAIGPAVFEYAPRAIKMSIVGFGGAEKAQIGHMVKSLLHIEERVSADAADALAVALCHAHARRLQSLTGVAG